MLKLALKRILHRKIISLVTIIVIGLSFVAFLLLNSSLQYYADHLMKRTKGDLLIAGRTGTNVDLIMNAFYFRQNTNGFIKVSDLDFIDKNQPRCGLFNLYRFQGNPVCGTDLEYFSMRKLALQNGHLFSQLGECVIGSDIAQKFHLTIGDFIISDAVNAFDPGGSIPVQMKICGILQKTDSPDDKVLFTSLKTAWTIHGLGHSHLANTKGPDLSIKYVEFNKESLKDFHFHGELKDYPLTAALILPNSAQVATMLMTEGLNNDTIDIVKPEKGLKAFLKIIFQLDSLFQGILILVFCLILILFALLIYLTLKLRGRERKLFERLGVEASFFPRLVCAEWTLLFICGCLLGNLLSFAFEPALVQLFDQITKGN